MSITCIDLSQIALPIIQAPMAGVSTPGLAAAVSEAGGLGSLGIGASPVAQACAMIRETRALTARPFNVNVFCHRPAQRDPEREAAWRAHFAPLFLELGGEPPPMLDEIYTSFLDGDDCFQMLMEERPAFVSFHFGLPRRDQVDALRQAGITTMATATNLDEATAVERAGIDVVVAQGIEAGGHRGLFDPDGVVDEGLSTAVLVRLLVRGSKLPVVAAGGIMDGHGVRAALDLGASAAQLGTAFILCPESAANAGYRQELKSARAAVTRMTAVLSGRPARGIVNRFMEHGGSTDAPEAAAYPVAYDLAKQLNALAAQQGSAAFAAHWAGQGAPLARELPARELMRVLQDELGCERVEGARR